MTKKEETCPFCKKTTVQKLGKDHYICHNCGCLYKANENDKLIASLTKISKEEFFDIINQAFADVFGVEELEDHIKQAIEKEFSVKVYSYYKEIADLYAEAIYELDSDAKEDFLFDNVS